MKSSKKTQARHTTRPKAAKLETSKARQDSRAKAKTEPFADVAARAGAALADVANHPDCNPQLYNLIGEFLSNVMNDFGSLPSQLRSGLPAAFIEASTYQFERRDSED